jgi:hypothetical protein
MTAAKSEPAMAAAYVDERGRKPPDDFVAFGTALLVFGKVGACHRSSLSLIVWKN